MKIDFRDTNIEPQPNPKPLKVQRVSVTVSSAEGKTSWAGNGYIVNANLHPQALTQRW